MASFSAELHVAGYALPLIHCSYGTQQATGHRGRALSKVRRGPVEAEADVPRHQVLEFWAADAQQRQEATIIWRNSDTGIVLETLHLKAAYCVRYEEQFVSGDTGSGSYRCFFTLADPDGWTLHAGTPLSETTIRPPAREHGVPSAPLALGAAALGGAPGPAAPFVVGPDGVPRLPRITGAPPFTVKGPGKGKPGLDRVEFSRQLTGQQDGLNRLTVAEFLANRDRYLKQAVLTGDGRAAEGDAAQRLAREDAFSDKIRELRSQNRGLTEKQAEGQAQQWLDTQAALHDPDQVAGGHADRVTGLGDARVNSSIGAQWPKRIKAIDRQIRAHAVGMTATEQASTYLDIALPLAS